MSTPLVLDLNGDGISTLNQSANVFFDINATGTAVNTGWVGSGDGLLAIDVNGDGVINDGSELFGSSYVLADGTTASNGFEALASLDSNDDGVINSDDTAYSSLLVWEDVNQDGISQSDELFNLSALNITSISVTGTATSELNNGNWVGLTSSFETADGTTHTIADVWFETDGSSGQNIDLTALSHATVSAGTLGLINLAGDNGQASELVVNADAVGYYGSSGLVSNTGASASTVQMVVNGDTNDSLHITDATGAWVAAGTTEIDGKSYNIFNDGDFQLVVSTEVHTWIGA